MKYTLFFLAFMGSLIILSCHQASKASETSIPETSVNKSSQPKPQIDSNKWKGDWERTLWQAGAGLIIKSFNGNKFHFEIEAASGANSGEIKGEGELQGDSAVSEETESCRLTFKLSHDLRKIQLTATAGCSQFAGNGVYFEGDYEKNGKPKKETLITLGVLTQDRDHRLRILVDTFYKQYIDCTDLVDTEDHKDLDSLDAAVITSGVKGLFTEMEYIIMVDKKSHIWTAIIDNDTVHYFTNSDLFKDHLPKTIENWRENFKDKPVVYHKK